MAPITHAKKYRRADGIAGIAKTSIRKIARRAGIYRIKKTVHQTTRELIEIKLRQIIPKAMNYAKYNGHESVITSLDILYAIKKTEGMGGAGQLSPTLLFNPIPYHDTSITNNTMAQGPTVAQGLAVAQVAPVGQGPVVTPLVAQTNVATPSMNVPGTVEPEAVHLESAKTAAVTTHLDQQTEVAEAHEMIETRAPVKKAPKIDQSDKVSQCRITAHDRAVWEYKQVPREVIREARRGLRWAGFDVSVSTEYDSDGQTLMRDDDGNYYEEDFSQDVATDDEEESKIRKIEDWRNDVADKTQTVLNFRGAKSV